MFKMWRPKNSFDALLPIEFFNWFFCFEIIQYPRNYSRIGLSIIWTILTFVMYFIALYYVFSLIKSSNVEIVGANITVIMVYLNISIYFCTVILMWIWKDRRRTIKLKIKKIDEALENLNVPVDYCAVFFHSIKLLVIWIIMIIVTSTMNIYLLWHKFHILNNILLISVLQHTFHTNIYFTLNISTAIVHIGERFNKINKLLLDCLEEKKSGERINRKWPPAQLFFNVSGKFHGHTFTSQDSTNDILRLTKRLHLELCGLCDEFSRIYGIQIAIILTASIVSVIGFIFAFYTIMVASKMNTMSKIFRVIFLIIRLSSFYLSVCVTNINSADTIIEWEKTGRILHELEIVSKNKEHRQQICQFSLQIIKNPLTFTACGLVSLGYDFLRGFVGSVTTYAIIFIQMYHKPK